SARVICLRIVMFAFSGVTPASPQRRSAFFGRSAEARIRRAARKKALLDHLVGGRLTEKQKINDDEGCDHATSAEGEDVANVVSGHALACLDCSFDDPSSYRSGIRVSLC